MKRKDAYYEKKECVLWKGRKLIMVKDKVQGDVPCNVNRHEARRNETHKKRSEKPESSYGRATIKATYA